MAEEEKPGPGSAEIEERRRRPHQVRPGAELRQLAGRGVKRRKWDEPFAERAVVSVLCRLQQRVELAPAGESEATPKNLAPLLHVCSVHEGLPTERIGTDELLRRIAQDLDVDVARAELVTREVLTGLREQLGEQEAEGLEGRLPHDLLPLWRLPF